jgi:hypothetical protein
VFRKTTGTALALAAVTGAVAVGAVAPASGHRSGCHRSHTCPSDHATYRWRQPSTGAMLLCVAPYADERTSAFSKRIVYQGRTYWCKPPRSSGGSTSCDPNYKGACLKPNVSDYDCAGGSGDGPYYVQGPVTVVGDDHYHLDRDGDGIACES